MPVDFQEGVVMDLVVVVVVEIETEIVDQLGLTERVGVSQVTFTAGTAPQRGHLTGSLLKICHHASAGRISRITCAKQEKLPLQMPTSTDAMKVL